MVCSSCKKQCIPSSSSLVLELDSSVRTSYENVPGTQAFIQEISVIGNDLYAFTSLQDRCNSHGLVLRSNGAVCNTSNISFGAGTEISAQCTDGVDLYYFVMQQSTHMFQLYKKPLGGSSGLVTQFLYNPATVYGIRHMLYDKGKLYWLIMGVQYSLQSLDVHTLAIQTVFVRPPEFYYDKIIKYRGAISVLGGYKAAWPERHIVNTNQQMVWQVTQQDNKWVMLVDSSGIYTMTADMSSSNIQEIGHYSNTGQYKKMYEVTNNLSSGAVPMHAFLTTKGVLYFIEGTFMPSVKDVLSGKSVEGRIFLQQGSTLLPVSNHGIYSGEADVFLAETKEGFWMTNFLTGQSSTGALSSNVQFFRWKTSTGCSCQ